MSRLQVLSILQWSVFSALFALSASGSAAAQGDPREVSRIANLAGPRIGLTFLSGGITDRLKKDHNTDLAPLITQFGWQTENRFASGQDGFTGISEVVVLVGGLEQSQFLPSLSWIVGVRTAEGVEFGLGPNLTPISAALAFVGGFTNKVGSLNVPVNVAVVPSSSGIRISVLTGFNMNR